MITMKMVCMMMTGFCRDTSRCICSFNHAFTSDHADGDDDAAHNDADDDGDDDHADYNAGDHAVDHGDKSNYFVAC